MKMIRFDKQMKLKWKSRKIPKDFPEIPGLKNIGKSRPEKSRDPGIWQNPVPINPGIEILDPARAWWWFVPTVFFSSSQFAIFNQTFSWDFKVDQFQQVDIQSQNVLYTVNQAVQYFHGISRWTRWVRWPRTTRSRTQGRRKKKIFYSSIKHSSFRCKRFPVSREDAKKLWRDLFRAKWPVIVLIVTILLYWP